MANSPASAEASDRVSARWGSPQPHRGEPPNVARVSLLIRSHALPPFSYRVPERLGPEVWVGTVVVAPLSGYSRLGVVVAFEGEAGDRPLEELRAVAEGLSLPEGVVRLCGWAAGAAALPPPAVLRMALPPGLATSTYEVRRPAPDWPWKAGDAASRTALRRTLGGEGLKAAEEAGRVVFAPAPPARRTVEWVVAGEAELYPPRRAHRQRDLLEALAGSDDGLPVAELLRASGAGREVLRRLARRGAVRLEKRPEPAPVFYTRGSGAKLAPFAEEVEGALSRGGVPFVWRMPDGESVRAAAAVARAAARRGEQTLVLAPEIGGVERLVEAFVDLLPAGLTVAPYHGALGGGPRSAVYEAAHKGEVDVLVGTRAAALAPLERPGAICVMDEPNEAHRADSGGYEGVPLHVRELARARGRIEDRAVFFFSPCPSLRLYAPESGARRLPAIEPSGWPSVAVVDMRGTGALLSSALLGACRQTLRAGGRAGVVAGRAAGRAAVTCNRCGFVRLDPERRGEADRCPDCGSERLSEGAGLAADRVRDVLAGSLGVEVGLVAMDEDVRGDEPPPVVVGSARRVLEGEWDLVVVPGADALLFGASVEKGFRVLYGAAGASRGRLLVQTRSPEHPVLRAALRGDYEAFASAELPKRRALGYPPHAHLARITLQGPGGAVRRAVESKVRPALKSGVELLEPVPVTHDNGERPTTWRVLLRSRWRGALAEAAALVAREAATGPSGGLKARIEMDPEEV